MHLVQKMSVQKRADFLEAIKGIKESSECNGGVEGTGESAEEDSSDNGDTL
jgi:hypothetical protein